jgi:hypothetical protein
MTQSQEQKLSRYLLFQEHISRNPYILDKYSNLKPLYELFNKHLLLILKTKEMLDEQTQNKSLREELVSTTVSFCRKITSFALLEEISELQGMCFSNNELLVSNDQDLIKTCQLVLNKSDDFQDDLDNYGIDKQSIAVFRDQLDRFKASVHHNELSELIANQAFDEFSDLFKETDKIFEGKLETIILESTSKQ